MCFALQAAEPILYQRSAGHAVVASAASGLQTARASGSAKLRFPRAEPGSVEALVVNTSGGLTAGDTFSVDATVSGGRLVVSTPACERVYRCDGGHGVVRNTLAVAAGAHGLLLPQPTILFQDSALERTTVAQLADGARLTLCEGLVLGRAAMAEDLTSVQCSDRIEVWRGSELVFADVLRLTSDVLRGDTAALLAGHRAIGLVVHVDEDADAAVERARGVVDAMGSVLAGASAVSGVAVARCLAPSHTALQDALARLVNAMSGVLPPRAWAL